MTDHKQTSKLQEMLRNSSYEDKLALSKRGIVTQRLTAAQIDEAYELFNCGWGLVESLECVRQADDDTVINTDEEIETAQSDYIANLDIEDIDDVYIELDEED